MYRRVAATLAAVLATSGVAGAGESQEPEPRSPGPRSFGAEAAERVPGELIVRFRPGTRAAARADAHEGLAARTIRDLLLPGTQLVKVRRGLPLEQAIAAYERNPNVAYAEPNVVWHLDAVPDDPLFGSLWGLHNTGQPILGTPGVPDADVDAPEAWDTATGAPAITVGVVDSGIAYDHPDLAANMWTNPGETPGNGLDDDANGKVDDVRGYDFANNDPLPLDDNLHGTHVAGTIGGVGNNGMGVAGVNWDVNLAAIKVCFADGSCSGAAIADGFAYAGMMGFQVVNASLGGSAFSSAANDAIAASPNTLFVAAAGNEASDNDSSPRYPCNYPQPNIICVAATSNTDALASFSNYGLSTVDLGAPGVRVLSTFPDFEAGIFSEDFESGTDPFTTTWTSGGTSTWGYVDGGAGSRWIADSPAGSYGNNADTWAKTPAIDLSGKDGCRVDYDLDLDAQLDFDGLLIQASGDNASWATMDGWTGFSGGFDSFTTDVSPFDGDSSMWIRFRLISNTSVTGAGADIDNVSIRCVDHDGPYGPDDYAYLSGTSMATPHVAGAAALLWGLVPATPAAVKDAILTSVVPIPALSGKSVTGGRLNLMAAIGAITSPPEPAPQPPPAPAPAPAPEPTVKQAKDLVLKAKPKRVEKGSKARLKARIQPCGHHAGAPVELLKKKKTGFKKIAAKRTNARCVAKFRKWIKKTTRFRARTPQDEDHLAATSKKVRVRVV